MSQVELEIAQLAEQLQTLRLPHKLNQYRAYQRRLLSLKKSTADSEPSYQAQLDRLQSQLDSSVLCGVSECFLCGSEPSATFTAAPPVYRRSVSASATTRPTPAPHNKPTLQPRHYNNQISCNDHLAKTNNGLTKLPPSSVLPTPPESPATASVTSEDSFGESDPAVTSAGATVVEEADTADSSNTASGDTALQNTSDLSLGNQDAPQTVRQIASSLNRDKQSDNPWTEKKDVSKSASGLPSRTNSYRAYKDFVNNYATDRNKTDQLADKRVA